MHCYIVIFLTNSLALIHDVARQSCVRNVFPYISTGVLESPEDFESSEELYEALGGMIEGALGEDEEGRDVHFLCQQLFSIALGYVCPFLLVYSQNFRIHFTCTKKLAGIIIGEHKKVNLQTQIFTFVLYIVCTLLYAHKGFAGFRALTCTYSEYCMHAYNFVILMPVV